MLFEIIRFELYYRSRRPATYIYALVVLLISVLAVTTDAVQIVGADGPIKENAPIAMARLMVLMSSIFFIFIASAIMGVAVLRDFEHQTEAVMFSNPLRKVDYLAGRFIGSYIVMMLVFLMMPLGMMGADLYANLFPGDDADKVLPFNALTYLQPFALMIMPNLFLLGSLFFVSGALSRKMMVVYTQGILLLVLYIVAQTLSRDLEKKDLAALIDPFGLRGFALLTQYWTVAERNMLQVPLEGMLLYNRLIVIGASLLALVIGYFGFSFNVVREPLFRPRPLSRPTPSSSQQQTRAIPKAQLHDGLAANLTRYAHLSLFHFTSLFKEPPFLALVFCGIMLFVLNVFNMQGAYGLQAYPTSYRMVEMISGNFGLFFYIIIVFYSGEMIWKERTVKINLIYDALPMPDFLVLAGKFTGLVSSYAVLIFGLILTAMAVQASKDYFIFEPGIYFSALYGDTFFGLLLLTMLGFFIQVMVNDKFVGFVAMVVFFLLQAVLSYWDVEHQMFLFNSQSLGSYSDMNTYGHFVLPFGWFGAYWAAFSVLLFGIATVFSVRGSEAIMSSRLQVGRLRLTKPVLTLLFLSLFGFVGAGAFIFYNTNVLNEYNNSEEFKDYQAEYEKTLGKYKNAIQPKIIESDLRVELYPSSRDFTAEGFYWLKNRDTVDIHELHLTFNPDKQYKLEKLAFSIPSKVEDTHRKFGFFIHHLERPLAPGDSMKMEWKMSFTTSGFVQGGSNTSVVHNGTFFNNTYFPSLGYSEGFEIGDDDDRKEKGLAPKERTPERSDMRARQVNLFGPGADFIRFQIVIGTEPDQIAIAPGYLQKEWNENGRRYFHYRMDVPMCNFYSVVSARYEVMRDKWVNGDKEVALEIYYHKGHEYNLKTMMDGMKQSLDYYSKNFSAFQFRQMRIMEFPRYATFAQSYANTVPFSEGIGFIVKVGKDDVDMPFYVTAHEVAHQWWGHQVCEAGVRGSSMLSESLSQYSAMMVMKKAFAPEQLQKYLEHELDDYLIGRTTEQKKEMPLMDVEGQPYIHYNKGSLIFFALQDYIGEDSLNAALSRYVKEWQFREAPYPTTEDLMKHIRAVTPDSLQYLITDMFETITLFENKAEEVTYEKLAEDKYKVRIAVQAQKFRADTLGVETPTPINDLIDIGIYGKKEEGDKFQKLIYLQKHRLRQERDTIEIIVDKKPVKAGIDPLNKLIDRHPRDNTKAAETAKKDS